MRIFLSFILCLFTIVSLHAQADRSSQVLLETSKRLLKYVEDSLVEKYQIKLIKKETISSLPDLFGPPYFVIPPKVEEKNEFLLEWFGAFKKKYKFTCTFHAYKVDDSIALSEILVDVNIGSFLSEIFGPTIFTVRGESADSLLYILEYTTCALRNDADTTVDAMAPLFLTADGFAENQNFSRRHLRFLVFFGGSNDSVVENTLVTDTLTFVPTLAQKKKLNLKAPFTLEVYENAIEDGDVVSVDGKSIQITKQRQTIEVTSDSFTIRVETTGLKGLCTPSFRVQSTGEEFSFYGKAGEYFLIESLK